MKEQILQLKKENPTWGYRKIAKVIGCSHNAVKFHLSEKCKQDHRRRSKKWKKNNPIYTKLEQFVAERICRRISQQNKVHGNVITVEEVFNKIGENPKCYLTGRSIDLNSPSTYHFDHIIPKSKGGDNSLQNLQIACKTANQSKHDMLVSDFLDFCKEVLEYNGYNVSKN